MKRQQLKYTGAKTSIELGSAMVPESTLVVRSTGKVKPMIAKAKRG